MTDLRDLNDQLAREVDGLLALVYSASYGAGSMSAGERDRVLSVSLESLDLLASTTGLASMRTAVDELLSIVDAETSTLDVIGVGLERVRAVAEWSLARA